MVVVNTYYPAELAIKNGNTADAGHQTEDLEPALAFLLAEERDWFARSWDYYAVAGNGVPRNRLQLTQPGPAGIAEAIKILYAKAKEAEAAELVRAEEWLLSERHECTLDLALLPGATRVQVQAKLDENERYRVRVSAAKAAERAEKEAIAAKDKAEKEAAEEAERLEWIALHGSDHLKDLVKYALSHEKIYQVERLALDRPGWAYDAPVFQGNEHNGTTGDAFNPPVAAVGLLKAWIEVIPEAQLRFVQFYRKFDEYNDDRYVNPPDRDGDVKTRSAYCLEARFLGRLAYSPVAGERPVKASRLN